MSRGTKTTFLTLATICMAGCATSGFVAQPLQQKTRPSVQDARIYNARPEVPPKILPETYFAAGSLLEAQGQLGGAIAQYQKATAVNHNYVAAYHRLGLLLSAVGRHEDATTALRRAAVLLPDNATLRNNLGYSLMLQQLWADAEGEFARALELSPGFPRAHINRGMAQSKLGRFDAALVSFEAVLPEAEAFYNLGLMYRGQHRFEKAVETFGHVLSIKPGFTAASTQLEQLAPHFPPALPSEPVAGPAEPVTKERNTIFAEQLPTPFDPVVWDEVGPPIKAAVSTDRTTAVEPFTPLETMSETNAAISMDRTTAVESLTPLETMSETTAALGEFPEYPLSAEEVEAELQIVRNEIDCLEERQAQEEDEFTLDFADLVCEPKPFVVSDASIASEADFVADAGEEDEFFGPWISTSIDVQFTLDQLLGILPPPATPPVKTMGMSIVPPDQDTIDACPADEPEIASHAFVEEQPDPCEEEEQGPNRDRTGLALQDS